MKGIRAMVREAGSPKNRKTVPSSLEGSEKQPDIVPTTADLSVSSSQSLDQANPNYKDLE